MTKAKDSLSLYAHDLLQAQCHRILGHGLAVLLERAANGWLPTGEAALALRVYAELQLAMRDPAPREAIEPTSGDGGWTPRYPAETEAGRVIADAYLAQPERGDRVDYFDDAFAKREGEGLSRPATFIAFLNTLESKGA